MGRCFLTDNSVKKRLLDIEMRISWDYTILVYSMHKHKCWLLFFFIVPMICLTVASPLLAPLLYNLAIRKAQYRTSSTLWNYNKVVFSAIMPNMSLCVAPHGWYGRDICITQRRGLVSIIVLCRLWKMMLSGIRIMIKIAICKSFLLLS